MAGNVPENLNTAIRSAVNRGNLTWYNLTTPPTSHNELAEQIERRTMNRAAIDAKNTRMRNIAPRIKALRDANERYGNAAVNRATFARTYNEAARNAANVGFELMSSENKANKLATNAYLRNEHERNYMESRLTMPSWAPADPYFTEMLQSLLREESAETYLDSYTPPRLRSANDIAAAFPVDVTDLGNKRYSVSWNDTKIERGEAKPNVSYAEHSAYPDFALFRLIYTLASTRQFIIEPPTAENGDVLMIVTHTKVDKNTRRNNVRRNNTRRNNTRRNNVRRNNTRRTIVRPNAVTAAPASYERIDDVGAIYPIVWNKLSSSNSMHAYYGIGIHEGKMRAYLSAHSDMTREHVIAEIHEALMRSTYWVVIPGQTGSEIARIRTITKKDRDEGMPPLEPMPVASMDLPPLPAKVDAVLSRLGLPIVWGQANSVWTISIHGKKLRDSGRSRADVIAALRSALAAYSGWTQVPISAGNANALFALRLL